MNYSILTIPPFDKQLAKKYSSLKKDYSKLLESLGQNPQQGAHLGNNCYKIRMAISSKGKGKSAGVRVITNFIISQKTVYLISVYDKSERENLTDGELKELLKNVPK